MKKIMRLTMVLIVLLITSAVAFAEDEIPARYDLDDQLEKTLSIPKYSFVSWDKVDSQSFVLQTSPNDYYLIILSKPSDKLLLSETISIDTSDTTVEPGSDKVIVSGQGYKEWNIINKIYRLKDAAQAKRVRKQLEREIVP